jgi:hypothetical protein
VAAMRRIDEVAAANSEEPQKADVMELYFFNACAVSLVEFRETQQ